MLSHIPESSVAVNSRFSCHKKLLLLFLFFKSLADSVAAGCRKSGAHFNFLSGTAAFVIVVDAVSHVAADMADAVFIRAFCRHVGSFFLEFNELGFVDFSRDCFLKDR